jgi:F-type H+-transporting ATPase subunit a
VDNPGATQQCMEALLHNNMNLGVSDLIDSNIGHGGERYLPMIGSIGLFVLISNLISLVPGLSSPTAEVSVPLGCAIVVFVYYHWSGLRKHGPIHYGAHFMGPNIYLSPLMVVVESVSHLARLLSLTVRFAGHANPAGYILAPVPLVAPALFIILHIFVAFVQAFVFTILPVIYLSGAVSEAH